MDVFVRVIGAGITDFDKKVTLPNEATVNILLQNCAADESLHMEYGLLMNSNYIVNMQLATIDTKLHDGDNVLVLRVLGGG